MATMAIKRQRRRKGSPVFTAYVTDPITGMRRYARDYGLKCWVFYPHDDA